MGTRILLVEDNQDIANLVAINLGMLDFEVSICSDGEQAYKQLHQPFDLAILDIMLPGKLDGLALCQNLRNRNQDIPIMMLTAKSSEQDVVTGFNSGADDYLSKPFRVLELQARVKALLRRQQRQQSQSEQQQLCFHALQIDPNTRQVLAHGSEIKLTVTEFDLLWCLASQPERAFSRMQLLSKVWGHQHEGYSHTVNSTVNRLRAKLEQDPATPEWIQTLWGVGYKFTGQAV